VNMISNAANVHEFRTEFTADRRKICMYPWPHM
jgi:hypothetical protein